MLILIPISINSLGKVELLSEFFDSLFLFQRANKQLSILLGYDIAIQALNYPLAFIGCMNHAVLAFIQADVLAYLGIASLILWKQGTEAAPAPKSLQPNSAGKV